MSREFDDQLRASMERELSAAYLVDVKYHRLDGKYALITEQEHGVVERIPAPRPGMPLHMPSI